MCIPKINGLSLLLVGTLLAACASNKPQKTELEAQLKSQRRDINTLKAELAEKEKSVEHYKREAGRQAMEVEKVKGDAAQASTESMYVETNRSATSSEDLLPVDAKPGECYARVFIPPKYETFTESLTKNEASERMSIIPAKYEIVEQRILVEEETTILKEVPAQYEWQDEKVLVKAEHTVWKKGRGPVEKVDNATGEIMCLVKVPAQYKTIRKRVTVKPPTTETIVIPAKYRPIKVKRETRAPSVTTAKIDAEYQTVTKRNKISEGYLEWHPVLCETNMTLGTVSAVQRALKRANYNPGPIDGVYGAQTRRAVYNYQVSKNMATGGLTLETLGSLGVSNIASK